MVSALRVTILRARDSERLAGGTRFRARREETMHQILSTWPGEDIALFLHLLSRLNDDLETYRPLLARTTAADPVPPFPARRTMASCGSLPSARTRTTASCRHRAPQRSGPRAATT